MQSEIEERQQQSKNLNILEDYREKMRCQMDDNVKQERKENYKNEKRVKDLGLSNYPRTDVEYSGYVEKSQEHQNRMRSQMDDSVQQEKKESYKNEKRKIDVKSKEEPFTDNEYREEGQERKEKGFFTKVVDVLSGVMEKAGIK